MITSRLYDREGTISNITRCNCSWIAFFEKKGRLGMSVKRNKSDGGMAMMKLYAMAEARSESPCVFI